MCGVDTQSSNHIKNLRGRESWTIIKADSILSALLQTHRCSLQSQLHLHLVLHGSKKKKYTLQDPLNKVGPQGIEEWWRLCFFLSDPCFCRVVLAPGVTKRLLHSGMRLSVRLAPGIAEQLWKPPESSSSWQGSARGLWVPLAAEVLHSAVVAPAFLISPFFSMLQ